jgi:hypothetical protein
MGLKITQYTPVSQSFIDTDLLDISKHVTLTSGALTIGVKYTILDFQTGDNFTNVAQVVSGVINTTGCVFIATGTTPTTYSNGSTLAYYETQSATWADLKSGLAGGKKVYKALLTQTGTDAPVATVLENTLSGTPVWSYDGVGLYYLTLSGEFPDINKIFTGFCDWSDVSGTFLPLSNGSSIVGYYTFYYGDANKMQLYIVDNTFTPANLGSLVGTSRLGIQFEVYP